MAEDKGDKTEAPTPRRLLEAREEGQIARSPDLTSAALLVGMMVLLNNYGSSMVRTLKGLMGEMLSGPQLRDIHSANLPQLLLHAILAAGAAMAPLMIGVVIIAIVANVAQVGFGLHPKRLKPNFQAFNPLKGVGRIFKGSQTWMQLVMNIAKMILVALVAWSAVSGRMGLIVTSQRLEFNQIFNLGATVMYAIGLRIGIVLLVLAILDYAWQRFRTARDLRMTKQEVKEEMRRMEGDPKIKQRRKQIAQQISTQRMRQAVPEADVVVTNPTEFAIALKYDKDSMRAPRVVAKGQGYMAQQIRQLAIASGVPILERKPLARALFRLVEVGQEIPEEFYAAVAEILAYVYELSGAAGRHATV